jgi:hypothetical protein
LFEQEPASVFDVTEVEKARPLPSARQFLQQRFSLDERQRSQVSAVHEQQIKSNEHALPPAEQEIPKYGSSGFIYTCDLTIKHRTFDSKMLGDPVSEVRKSSKCVSISRNQFAFAVADVCERTKAIDLQFEDVMIRVERLGTA